MNKESFKERLIEKNYSEWDNKELVREYDELSALIQKTTTTFLGYPLNENSGLSAFYKWYVQSGLLDLVMNNAGDPSIPSHLNMDALKIENKLVQDFAKLFDFPKDDFWGIVTTGGTDGNNHGIYFGKRTLWEQAKEIPILYVSDQAHYSNRRLGHLQGMEVRIVPTDEMGSMIPAEFEKALDPTKPALVIFAMGTTFKGAMDDIDTLNQIIARKKVKYVYRHVDAALFGGYLIFTGLSHLVSKQKRGYDSIAISGHKWFGVDEPCGIMLCTNKVFAMQKSDSVPYLTTDMPMISCSRCAQSPMKLYWLLHTRGKYGYARDAYICLQNAKYLYEELCKINYPAWLGPASNTVFFKRPCEELMHKYSLAPDHDDRLCGDLAHIIVMQHVRQPLLDRFLRDLRMSLQ